MRHALTVIVVTIGCLAGAQSSAAAPRETFQYTPDTTPPETTITAGPAEGSTTNSDSPAFMWDSSEAGSTFTCTEDGKRLTSCELAFATGAAPGPHTFTVAATDAAGNTDPTPAVRHFTVSLQGSTPDLPRCPYDGNVVIATAADDTRIGTSGTDVMFGLGGNDVLRSGPGQDCIAGQSGNDTLYTGPGNDFAFGGPGADRLYGEAGNDELRGEAGDDRIDGGPGRDILVGDAGNDRLTDSSGRDSFSGGPGNDRIDARDATALGRRTPDSVRCGSGSLDVAIVDKRDSVGADCERVIRR
jgi:Ca2+-binding RTX toxin-like protein